jgi:uncharacterized DUF497 family protein
MSGAGRLKMMKKEIIRGISAREANKRERRIYLQQTGG